MDIEEIIQRVKAEAERLEQPAAGHGAASSGSTIAGRPGASAVPHSISHIDELLGLDPPALVTAAYRHLLGREPDDHALVFEEKLHNKQLTPVMLLGHIRFSGEGRRRGARLKGLMPRLLLEILKKIPLLGFVLDRAVGLARLPQLKNHVMEMTRQLQALHDMQASMQASKADRSELDVKADSTELDAKADRTELDAKADRSELDAKADRTDLQSKVDRQELDAKADSSEVAAYREGVRYAERYFHLVTQELRALMQELRSSDAHNQLPDKPADQPVDQPGDQSWKEAQAVAALTETQYDKLYLDFEYRYRGSPEEVTRLLHCYTTILGTGTQNSDNAAIAIDLGCGRGEMVHYCKNLGYQARGIDLNRLAVQQCREQNLHVTYDDALNHLHTLEPGSVNVLSALHLIEHLHYEDMFCLLQRGFKALAPGGLILLETPNPRNLFVGASDFYRDFTHNKPLFPDTLCFLLEYFGFERVEVFFFITDEDGRRRLRCGRHAEFNDLADYLEISREYTVVGYKPCG